MSGIIREGAMGFLQTRLQMITEVNPGTSSSRAGMRRT